jgi:hypothetical protein
MLAHSVLNTNDGCNLWCSSSSKCDGRAMLWGSVWERKIFLTVPSDPIRRLHRDTRIWLNGLKSVQLPVEQFFFHSPSGSMLPRCRSFEITLRHTTVGRTPQDEWSVRCRNLYLKTQNTHKTQTSLPPAGFELAIPARERPQIHTVDGAATGIGCRAVTDTSINIYAHSKFVHKYTPLLRMSVVQGLKIDCVVANICYCEKRLLT